MLSLTFPLLHTVHETFTSHGVPSMLKYSNTFCSNTILYIFMQFSKYTQYTITLHKQVVKYYFEKFCLNIKQKKVNPLKSEGSRGKEMKELYLNKNNQTAQKYILSICIYTQTHSSLYKIYKIFFIVSTKDSIITTTSHYLCF